MSYETVILEMLSRIQNLENEVNAIKQQLQASSTAGIDDECQDSPASSSSVQYTKMTDEMIEACYRCGKKVYQGENPQRLADDIAAETGMNRSSAIMYLYAVSGMLGGVVYKRAISSRAMKMFFDKIWSEFGSVGLKRAIRSTRLHIDYRIECGHKVDSIEKICDEYEHRI